MSQFNNIQLEDVSNETFMDLFGEGTPPKNENKSPNFSYDPNLGVPDLSLDKKEEKSTETLKQEDSKPSEEQNNTEVEADLLSVETQSTDTQVDTTNNSNNLYKDYFKKAIEEGKFIKLVEDEKDADGNEIAFIPSTPEEIEEFFELQDRYKAEQKSKEIEQSVYASKSPTWQLALKYSEMLNSPTELIPFLTSMETIESVENLDPEDLDQAEQIVRIKLQSRGDSEEIVQDYIETFKTTGKLIGLAQQYKPVILEQEKQATMQSIEKAKKEQEQYISIISNIRDNVVETLEKPFVGKVKLKQEEKAAVYDLIGEPSDRFQGYGIYTVIDNLFAKKDFDTLRDVALMLSNKQTYDQYIKNHTSQQTAASLERKIRKASEGRSSSAVEEGKSTTPSIKRNEYKPVRFGREVNK